jgi:hypothetical protein
LQIIKPMAAGKRAAIEQPVETHGPCAKKCRAALAEQIAVVQFVNRVGEVQPAQERVRRDLRGAKDIAPTITFNFCEREQFTNPPIRIAPDPPVNRSQHSIDGPDSSNCHRCVNRAYSVPVVTTMMHPRVRGAISSVMLPSAKTVRMFVTPYASLNASS